MGWEDRGDSSEGGNRSAATSETRYPTYEEGWRPPGTPAADPYPTSPHWIAAPPPPGWVPPAQWSPSGTLYGQSPGGVPSAPFGAPVRVQPQRVGRTPLHWVALVLLLLAFVSVPTCMVVGGVLGAQADQHNDTPDSAFAWGIVIGMFYGALAFIVLIVLAAAFSAGAWVQQRNRNRERPDLTPRPAVTATLVISLGLVVAMASVVIFTLLANIGN